MWEPLAVFSPTNCDFAFHQCHNSLNVLKDSCQSVKTSRDHVHKAIVIPLLIIYVIPSLYENTSVVFFRQCLKKVLCVLRYFVTNALPMLDVIRTTRSI